MHVSTLLGVQTKQTNQRKTDTTELVLENLWHKISFEKIFECCGMKTRSKIMLRWDSNRGQLRWKKPHWANLITWDDYRYMYSINEPINKSIKKLINQSINLFPLIYCNQSESKKRKIYQLSTPFLNNGSEKWGCKICRLHVSDEFVFFFVNVFFLTFQIFDIMFHKN